MRLAGDKGMDMYLFVEYSCIDLNRVNEACGW